MRGSQRMGYIGADARSSAKAQACLFRIVERVSGSTRRQAIRVPDKITRPAQIEPSLCLIKVVLRVQLTLQVAAMK